MSTKLTKTLLRYGFTLDEDKMFVITVSELKNKLSLNFDGENENVWVKEDLVGFEAFYKLSPDTTVGGYVAYKNTPSKDLENKIITVDTSTSFEQYLLQRKVAGGRSIEAGATVESKLTENLTVKGGVGYQKTSSDTFDGTQSTVRPTVQIGARYAITNKDSIIVDVARAPGSRQASVVYSHDMGNGWQVKA